MKIFQGIRNSDEIRPLLDAGADEFYSSYWDGRLQLRSQYEETASIRAMEDLRRSLDMIHGAGSKLFIAVNALYYGQDEINAYGEGVKLLVEAGVDGIVVANLGLLMHLSTMNLNTDLCLSTLQPVFNSSALGFFKRFGLKRVVLPEQISANEAAGILGDPDIETEAFTSMFNDHFYTESFCLFHHRRWLYLNIDPASNFQFCGARPVVAMPEGQADDEAIDFVTRSFGMYRRYVINDVGNLFDLHRAGLDFLKLGVRRFSLDTKLAALRVARLCVDALNEGRMGREEFIEMASRARAGIQSRYTGQETLFK